MRRAGNETDGGKKSENLDNKITTSKSPTLLCDDDVPVLICASTVTRLKLTSSLTLIQFVKSLPSAQMASCPTKTPNVCNLIWV